MGSPLILFNCGTDRADGLRALARRTGVPMAEHLRRMIDACAPAVSGVLGGAVVTGIEVHTTSGSVFLERLL